MTVQKRSEEQAVAGVQAIRAPEVSQAAAAGVEEILDQTIVNALNSARPETLIGPKPGEELRKGNTYRSTAWLHSPASLQMLAMAEGRLTRVANMQRPGDQAEVKQVDRVEAKLVPGTKLLVLRARPDSDQTAEPVMRRGGDPGCWINLFELLASAKLTVDTGYRELYAVHFVPKSSPLWPALVIDLGNPLDRRQEPKRKKQEEDPKE